MNNLQITEGFSKYIGERIITENYQPNYQTPTKSIPNILKRKIDIKQLHNNAVINNPSANQKVVTEQKIIKKIPDYSMQTLGATSNTNQLHTYNFVTKVNPPQPKLKCIKAKGKHLILQKLPTILIHNKYNNVPGTPVTHFPKKMTDEYIKTTTLSNYWAQFCPCLE